MAWPNGWWAPDEQTDAVHPRHGLDARRLLADPRVPAASGAGNRQKVPGSVTGTGKSAITSNYSATLGLSA